MFLKNIFGFFKKHDEFQHALDTLMSDEPKDFDEQLNIILSTTFRTNEFEKLDNAIKNLRNLLLNNEDKLDKIVINYNDSKSEDFQKKEEIEQRIKSLLNAITDLECRKIQIQRFKILSNLTDSSDMCIKIDFDDDTQFPNAIEQLLQLLESNGQIIYQALQKSNEYKNKNIIDIARRYLNLSIEVGYYQVYDIGNICFYHNIQTILQTSKNVIKIPNIGPIIIMKDITDFFNDLSQSILDEKHEKSDIDCLSDAVKKVRLVFDHNCQKIEEIKQKKNDFLSQNNEKMAKLFSLYEETVLKSNSLVDNLISSINTKIERIQSDDQS